LKIGVYRERREEIGRREVLRIHTCVVKLMSGLKCVIQERMLHNEASSENTGWELVMARIRTTIIPGYRSI
jgi:hypothetical protein